MQYNNSGSFGGLSTTGSGNVVLATSPTVTGLTTDTLTATGTTTIGTGWVIAYGGAAVTASPSACTFSGTVTGPRYDAYLNGTINTLGGGSTFFPGKSSGVTATGGQYV